MKNHLVKVILSIVLFLFIGNVIAQDTTKQWSAAIYDESFSPEHPYSTWSSYILKTMGDTVIGNLDYKKLFMWWL